MFDDLHEKINALFAELGAEGYEGKHQKVLDLVREARVALTKDDGTLPPWEAEELARAEDAVRWNWLRLAVFATEKAIAVSQLPADEYEYGFNYTKPKT